MEEYSFTIKYEFKSELGEMEGNRYINDITAKVFRVDEVGNPVEEAGRVYFNVLLLESALNDEFPIIDIFDTTDAIMAIGEEIYDFDALDFVGEIKDYYSDSFNGYNILIIERMEILPAFRTMELGKKIMKDIYIRFTNGVAMIAMKVFPLQLESSDILLDKDEKEWNQKMELGKFDRDEKKSQKKLYTYFKKLGFENLLDNDIFLLNPGIVNDEINQIEL